MISPFYLTAAGCAPHGLDSPSTGKPPVERASKTRVPTGRYVTTGKQHNTAIAQLAHVTQDCTKIPIGADRINSKHRRHNPATGETHGGF